MSIFSNWYYLRGILFLTLLGLLLVVVCLRAAWHFWIACRYFPASPAMAPPADRVPAVAEQLQPTLRANSERREIRAVNGSSSLAA